MKNLFRIMVCMLVLTTELSARTPTTDTLTREQFIKSQTVKSDTLNQQALALAKPGATPAELNKAINLIMSGLHTYSKFRDSTGLRETFDHLALVYHMQKKYVQAKWFYIQSSMLARDMKDTVNIIHSLVALSTVKADIKDFEMGDKDLAEALMLAKTRPGIGAEIEVQNSIAEYYTKRGMPKKINAALARISFLNDSLAKVDEPVEIPTVKQQPQVVQVKPKPVRSTGNSNLIISIVAIVIFIILLLLFLVKSGRKSGEN